MQTTKTRTLFISARTQDQAQEVGDRIVSMAFRNYDKQWRQRTYPITKGPGVFKRQAEASCLQRATVAAFYHSQGCILDSSANDDDFARDAGCMFVRRDTRDETTFEVACEYTIYL